MRKLLFILLPLIIITACKKDGDYRDEITGEYKGKVYSKYAPYFITQASDVTIYVNKDEDTDNTIIFTGDVVSLIGVVNENKPTLNSNYTFFYGHFKNDSLFMNKSSSHGTGYKSYYLKKQ